MIPLAGCTDLESRNGLHAGHHGHIDHEFKNPEKWAKQWNNPTRDNWQRPAEVIELMDIQRGMTVVDLGAGTGYFEPHLSKAVGETGKVLALDVSPQMIEYIQKSPRTSNLHNVEAKVVPSDNPQFPEGEIDRVLIVNTWHHIDDRVEYARKVARSLAPTGSIIIVDFTLESEMGSPRSMRLSPERVVSELQTAGFIAASVEESLPWQYIVVANLARSGRPRR
jgi:ubiquinone/menaquinone biosynthesis C-methylase UbiE